MALSREDKGDVKNALGKAVANKISKVTNDRISTNKSVNRKARTLLKSGTPYHKVNDFRSRNVNLNRGEDRSSMKAEYGM